ncbi:MAG: hypothetical protein RIS43_884, partial [Actinomycetota bacterium]
HTDSPQDVLKRAGEIADVRNIRIELLEQKPQQRKLVAQAFGSGVVQQLAELGVVVVAAEPDVRPSVQEFYSAGIRANSREVVVFASDKDSVQVAEIAVAELRREGIDAQLVATHTIVQTLAAISVANAAVDFAADLASIKEAAARVTAIGITRATRDSQVATTQISSGDFLAFVNAQLTSASHDIVDAVCSVAMQCTNAELVTVIAGRELSESDAEDVLEALQTMFPSAEIVLTPGHQEMWPLLIGIE